MKKILIVGNSHLSGVFWCARNDPDNALSKAFDIYFYVIPGGYGPPLLVENDKFILKGFTKSHPPYQFPPGTTEMPVSSFDAFFVSALGHFGDLKQHRTIQTAALLAEYGPTLNAGTVRPMLSDTCYRAVIAAYLDDQYGFKFLRSLRAGTDKPIAVQPCPYISDKILDDKNWNMRLFYKDAEGVNLFFARAKDKAILDACERSSSTFLGYPDPAWSDRGLTPSRFMRDGKDDMVHGGLEYARSVVRQIEEWAAKL